MLRNPIRLVTILAVLALTAGACGDDDTFGLATTTAATTTAATTTAATTTAATTTAATETTAATATTAGAETTQMATRYSESTRQGYLDGCVPEAGIAACECTLTEFERLYSEDEFIRLAIDNADATEPPPEMYDVILACVGELDDTPTPTVATGFSEEARNAYLEGCLEDGNSAYCICTLDEFEQVYTQAEFEALALQLENMDDLPDEFMDVIFTCLPELDG